MLFQPNTLPIIASTGQVPDYDFFEDRLAQAENTEWLEEQIDAHAVGIQRYQEINNGEWDDRMVIADTPTARYRASMTFAFAEHLMGLEYQPRPRVFLTQDFFVQSLIEADQRSGANASQEQLTNLLVQIQEDPRGAAIGLFGESEGQALIDVYALALAPYRRSKGAGCLLAAHVPKTDYREGLIMFYGPMPRVLFDLTAAHEFAHVVQEEHGLSDEGNVVRPLLEGHALGVEQAIAGMMLMCDDHRYQAQIMVKLFSEMIDAYIYICHQKGVSRRKSIDRLVDVFNIETDRMRSPHALGVSLFARAQEIHGKEIYKRLLRGDLEFLLV